MSRQGSRGQLQIMKQMSRQEYRGSAGDYQADEQAGVAGLSWTFDIYALLLLLLLLSRFSRV